MALCSPWATESDLCSPCMDAVLDYTEMSDYLLQASELLYMLSGQQFNGLCSETVRPCNRTSWQWDSRYGPNSWSSWGAWQWASWPIATWSPFAGFCGCHSYDSCSCNLHSAIELPRNPLVSIDKVTLDEVTIDPSLYELRGNLLVRIDGNIWPCCTDTLHITYTYGRVPPRSGVKAAAVLACELLMACDPDAVQGAACRLPRNISSITRQGVSVIFQSLTRTTRTPFRFGIWEIDIFLEAFSSSPTCAVLSPDTPMVQKIS